LPFIFNHLPSVSISGFERVLDFFELIAHTRSVNKTQQIATENAPENTGMVKNTADSVDQTAVTRRTLRAHQSHFPHGQAEWWYVLVNPIEGGLRTYRLEIGADLAQDADIWYSAGPGWNVPREWRIVS
jgi:hypothetical protein